MRGSVSLTAIPASSSSRRRLRTTYSGAPPRASACVYASGAPRTFHPTRSGAPEARVIIAVRMLP